MTEHGPKLVRFARARLREALGGPPAVRPTGAWTWNPESLPVVEGLAALKKAAAAKHEERFALQIAFDQAVRADKAAGLAATPELERVSALQIQQSVEPDGLKCLLKSRHLIALRSLSLPDNFVHDTGAKLLAKWEPLSKLTHLVLGSIGLGGPGFKALLESPYLGALEYLDVRSNNLKAPSIKGLASSPLATRLEACVLEFNEFGDGGVKAFAESDLVKERCQLAGVSMTKGGLKALLASPRIGGVRELDISANHDLGDDGLVLLAKAKLAKLEVLDIAGTGMTDASAAVLADAANLAKLTELRVNDSGGLTSTGMKALLASPHIGAAVRRGNATLEKERAKANA